MEAVDRVFVYGTLRRGGSNHSLLKGARLLGSHRTAPVYRMLDLGSYPGVVEPGDTAILGEVYGITRPMLARLDVLEDFPRSYTRRRIDTPWGAAWIYLYRGRNHRLRRVPRGDWLRR